jgi:hypothetical protein
MKIYYNTITGVNIRKLFTGLPTRRLQIFDRFIRKIRQIIIIFKYQCIYSCILTT